MRRLLTQLVVIADYGDNLAWGEVGLALWSVFPGVAIVRLNVPSFNTVAAGFAAAQLARRHFPDPERTALLINVDPRQQTDAPLKDGKGAPFVCAKLANGVRVFSPNAGACLSFLKREIRHLAVLSDGAGAGQFRSRDDFPTLMALALRQNGQLKEGSQSLEIVPDFTPADIVALWVDGYGNVKTSLTLRQARRLGWKPGKQVLLQVGGCGADYPTEIHYANSIMGVRPGQLVLAPGSSGDPADPYMEFAVRTTGPGYDDCGAKRLGCKAPGDPVNIAFPSARALASALPV